jgi:hypothetical protein
LLDYIAFTVTIYFYPAPKRLTLSPCLLGSKAEHSQVRLRMKFYTKSGLAICSALLV